MRCFLLEQANLWPSRCRREAALTGHFVLHSFSEIENEVKTVGNLLRLRRATPGSIGVQTVPVSADEFHSGAPGKPRGR